jgi:serine/threonine protein phosphatase PrpC
VCDGHGENGHLAADYAKVYVASNIQYLEIDNILRSYGFLFKNIELNFDKTKDYTNTLRFIYDKFKLNSNNLSFSKKNIKTITNIIKDSFNKTQEDIKDRSFEANYSGTTFCSVLILGKELYCANAGDSRAILGSNVNNVKN